MGFAQDDRQAIDLQRTISVMVSSHEINGHKARNEQRNQGSGVAANRQIKDVVHNPKWRKGWMLKRRAAALKG